MDVERELTNTEYIDGVYTAPVLGIAAAIKYWLDNMRQKFPDEQSRRMMVRADKSFEVMSAARDLPNGVTPDMAAAINIYTQDSPLYKMLNKLLRDRNGPELIPLFPYLRLLLSALHKMPLTPMDVYRGVKGHKAEIMAQYTEGRPFVWWSLTSTTSSVKALQSEQFLGTSGDRTKFVINARSIVNISRFSAHPKEDERLILPGTEFIVKGVLDLGNGLHEIQVKELYSNEPHIDFPMHPGLAEINSKLDYLTAGQSAMHSDLKQGFTDMSVRFDMLNIKIDATTAQLAKTITKALIEHSSKMTKRGYPSVYMLIPHTKPKGLFSMLNTKDVYNLYCLCEFQCASDDTTEPAALWHPVYTEFGGAFSVAVKEPKEIIKKLGPYLKVASIALKVGCAVAKMAGLPLPDISELIPQDLLQFEGSIVSAVTAVAQSAVANEDKAVIEAVKSKEVGSGRLLPKMMEGEQLALVKSLFGDAQVGRYEFVMTSVRFIKS